MYNNTNNNNDDNRPNRRSDHWAEAVVAIAVLLFIFGLVYLAHNQWHFVG